MDLQQQPDISMIKNKQLYHNCQFQLPDIGTIEHEPFSQKSTKKLDNNEESIEIDKLFEKEGSQYPTYHHEYIRDIENIIGKENIYPLFVGFNNKKIVVSSKDAFLLLDYKMKEKNQIQNLEQDKLIDLFKYDRFNLPQTPTTIAVGQFCIAFGFQAGKITLFNLKTKSFEGSDQSFEFTILQIQIFTERQNKEAKIIALDSAGNLKMITFSHKTLLDKIIKTLTSDKEISTLYRNKKRQKFKKIFKSFINKENQDQQNIQTNDQENFGYGTSTFPFFYNKFSLIKRQKNDQKIIVMCVFRRNILEFLILNEAFDILKQERLKEEFKDERRIDPIAMLQFGEGGFENSNNTYLILTFALNFEITYYRVIEIQQEYFEFVQIAVMKTEENLKNGTFISNNLLVFLTQKSLCLCNVNQKMEIITKIDYKKFSYIDYFIEEQKVELDKNLIYNQLLFSLPNKENNSYFFYLEGKRMVGGVVLDWNNYLDIFVKKQSWQEALRYSLKIYEGKKQNCCSIDQNVTNRNQKMKKYFDLVSKGYIQSFLEKQIDEKSDFNKEKLRILLNNVLYYLLKVQNFADSFPSIMSKIKQKNLQQILLQSLQPYIENKSQFKVVIPSIDQQNLNLIIEYYKKNNKKDALEIMFMNFDIKQMDNLVMLTICLAEQLYQSLLFICCEQRDYITPILKLCGIKFNNQMKKESPSFQQVNQRLSDIIFWYIRQCLLGHNTEYGNDASYIHMLSILINFIFIPSQLGILLLTSAQDLMKVVNMFFSSQIFKFILENQSKFFMRKGEYLQTKVFQDSCLSEFTIYQKMISTLIHVVQQTKQNSQLNRYQKYKLLILLMLKNQFPFKLQYKKQSIIYYIKNPLLFEASFQQQKDQQIELSWEMEQWVNGRMMRLMDSIIRSIEEKYALKGDQEETVINTLSCDKQKALLEILESISICEYSFSLSELKCYIYHEMGNFTKVIETYLKMSNKNVRLKIFQYFSRNINDYSELSQDFITNLLSLLNLDQQRTLSLLYSLREEHANHEQIITRLVEYPALQLNYIEQLVFEKKYINRKLLLTHLQIVIKHKINELEDYIQKIDYPLEEAYKVCEEHNNRIGKAYILIKSGRNMEGVLMLSEVFLELYQEYLKHLAKSKEFDPQKKDKMEKQFHIFLETCTRSFTIDPQKGEQIWQKSVDLIFRKLVISKMDNPKLPPQIKESLNEVIFKILKKMFSQVSTGFFLEKFCQNFNIPMKVFLQAFNYVNDRLQFQFLVQKLDLDLVQIYEFRLWSQIMKNQYQGTACYRECSTCLNCFSKDEKMVAYPCQHIFHLECYLELNNKKTKMQLCPLCYNDVENYLICGDSVIQRICNPPEKQEFDKAKFNKMEVYDRNSMQVESNWSL